MIHRMLQKSSKQRPTLKELQSMKGPNGVFERHIKEGCLRIREHRFNYRCLLEQRELKRERKDLKSREKKLRESEMEMEARERKLREREMEMERREMELRERETKLIRTAAKTRRRSNSNLLSSSSEMSTEEDTKSATLETPPTVHIVGSDRRSSLNRRRVESSDSTSSIKIMSLAKTFEERMATLNRTPSTIVGAATSIASSPSELGSNLRPRLVRRESSSDSSSSSEKIKLKAYMEYRRHAKLEFVSPKPVNKRGGVSRPVFSDSSDGVVVDDVVLNYE